MPGADRRQIVWRTQFLLGALYYTLIKPERIERLSDSAASGTDHETAIRELVDSAHASFRALAPDHAAVLTTAN